MSDTWFFVIKWIALTVAFGAAVIPTFFPVRDDTKRFTRLGRAGLALAVGAFGFSALADQQQKKREAREQAVADSTSQAKADARTRHEEMVLRDESERLRSLQRQALVQIDSVGGASRLLTDLQQNAIQELQASLSLSQRISDSLQASVALSRQIVDSMRLAEARAAERSRETLAMVRRTQNPMTPMRASLRIDLYSGTPHATALLNQLQNDRRRSREIPRLGRGISVQMDGRRVSFGFPETVDLRIWPAGKSCPEVEMQDPLIWARRELNYDSVKLRLFTDVAEKIAGGLNLEVPEGEFQITTNQELTVEDLRDACVLLSFYGYAGWEGAAFWQQLQIALWKVVLPQGRRGRVIFGPVHGTHFGRTVWAGRLELETELW